MKGMKSRIDRKTAKLPKFAVPEERFAKAFCATLIGSKDPEKTL